MNKAVNSNDIYKFFRVCIYILEFFIFFSVQQIPGFIPEMYGGRPLLLIPLFFSISLLEGNYLSLIWGVLTGFILDISFSRYIGVQLIIMGILGNCIGKIKDKLFGINIFIFSFLCLIFEPIIILLRFYLNYGIKGLEYPEVALYNHVIPGIVYTLIISPIIYLINRPIVFFIQRKDGEKN